MRYGPVRVRATRVEKPETPSCISIVRCGKEPSITAESRHYGRLPNPEDGIRTQDLWIRNVEIEAFMEKRGVIGRRGASLVRPVRMWS